MLTLDELATAFLEYDSAGTLDDVLSEDEFAALIGLAKKGIGELVDLQNLSV